MSYTEYLRRKAATSEKVIDYQPKKVDASQFITQQRLAASTVFSLTTRKGVVANFNDPSTTGTTSKLVALTSTTKTSGGRVPDASSFTAYVGGNAIDSDLKNGSAITKFVLPANIPASLCTNSYVNGPAAPKSAGDWVRANAPCTNCREPHNPNEVGPAIFVGDTIAPNRSIGVTTTYVKDANGTFLGDNRVDHTANSANNCDRVILTHPADSPHNTTWAPRPTHGMGGIPVFTVPRPDDARKVGAYDYKDRQKYVEKHHGNDLNVNPRRVPTKFVPTNNAPAHLKINDPRGSRVV